MKIKSYVPCGAKLKSGQKCAKAPVKGAKRCRLHGGITTCKGAESPTAKPNDGLYTKFFTAEELIAYHSMELGNVDAEIKMVRLRLARAMRAEELDSLGQLPDIPANGRPRNSELESRKEVRVARRQTAAAIAAGTAPEMQMIQEERHYKKVDYRAAIHTCLQRLESLEKTRAELERMAKEEKGGDDLVAALTSLADRLPV